MSEIRTHNSPISGKQMFFYSLSEFGSNPVITITIMFMMMFYTDILNIDAALVGMVILASKIFDGASDILAGSIIDNTKSKHGSARAWILRSTIPLALSYVFLFTVPNTGLIGKIIYIFFSYNFSLTISFTLVNSAINVLPIQMTTDSKSRSATYAVRMIFAGLVQIVVSSLFIPLLNAFGGIESQSSWIIVGLIFGFVALTSNIITYFGTRGAVIESQEKKEHVKLIPAMKSILTNRYWLIALGIILIVITHQATVMTVNTYYAKYILGDVNMAGLLVLYHHGGGAIFMILLPFLLQKGFSKKKLTVLGACCMMAGSIVTLFSSAEVPLIISLVFRGMGFGIVQSIYFGMLADAAEYSEWKSGIKAYAISTSASSMGNKIGTGLVTAALGFALSLSGYDGSLAIQSQSTNDTINFIFNIFPIAIYVVLLILVSFYDLENKMPQIKTDLEKRKSNNA